MYTHHTNPNLFPKGSTSLYSEMIPQNPNPEPSSFLCKLVNCVAAFSSHKVQCCGSATPEQTRLRTEGECCESTELNGLHLFYGRSVRMCPFMVSAKLRGNSLSVRGTSHLQRRTSHLHQLVVLLLKPNWCERVKVTRNVFRSATFAVKPFFFLINTFY